MSKENRTQRSSVSSTRPAACYDVTVTKTDGSASLAARAHKQQCVEKVVSSAPYRVTRYFNLDLLSKPGTQIRTGSWLVGLRFFVTFQSGVYSVETRTGKETEKKY